jgi:hypothetical protein
MKPSSDIEIEKTTVPIEIKLLSEAIGRARPRRRGGPSHTTGHRRRPARLQREDSLRREQPGCARLRRCRDIREGTRFWLYSSAPSPGDGDRQLDVRLRGDVRHRSVDSNAGPAAARQVRSDADGAGVQKPQGLRVAWIKFSVTLVAALSSVNAKPLPPILKTVSPGPQGCSFDTPGKERHCRMRASLSTALLTQAETSAGVRFPRQA